MSEPKWVSPDNKTVLLGVVGENIEYTLSPSIHNYSFSVLGINAVYLRFDVKNELVEDAISGLNVIAYGYNVTIPYKEVVAKRVHPGDEVSSRLGSVNTVYKGKGFNTDFSALLGLLRESGVDIDDKRCVVIGAGGTGIMAVYALDRMGCNTLVWNRTEDRIHKALQRIGKTSKEIGLLKSLNTCGDPDVVVSTVPVPMEHSCIPTKLAVEYVYKEKTPFLNHALRKGIRVITGVDLLVRQAMDAERIWFGKSLNDSEVKVYLNARKLVWTSV